MKRPMRARSSGAASVMSSPLKRIWPSVTSRLGWPMMALASVDLPEPLGPMRAWISALLAVGERDELGEGRLRERLDDAALDARPQQLGGAAAAVVVEVRAEVAPLLAVVDEAAHRRDGALERQDDLVHGDRLRGARQPRA